VAPDLSLAGFTLSEQPGLDLFATADPTGSLHAFSSQTPV
jgi:hypothetical protein